MTQTACPWGHSYEGKNRGINPRTGHPFCKHCRRVSSRGTRRGGMTLEECYLLYPEWLDIESAPLPTGPRVRTR